MELTSSLVFIRVEVNHIQISHPTSLIQISSQPNFLHTSHLWMHATHCIFYEELELYSMSNNRRRIYLDTTVSLQQHCFLTKVNLKQ